MKALDQIDAKLDRAWKVREDRKKARVRQFNAKHGVKPMSAHTTPCNLGSIPFGGVVLPEVTIHTMANAVHTALTRLQSARTEEEAIAANRQFYKVLADTCRAYLGQFVDASGRARQGPAANPFPPEAANLLLHMIEGWLVGRMDQPLKDLVRRAGTPGHTLRARNDIEAACRYMQATKGATPLIQDGSAQKRVGEWFGVVAPQRKPGNATKRATY